MKKILLINILCLSLFACTNNNDEHIANLTAPKEVSTIIHRDQNYNSYEEFYKDLGNGMHWEFPFKGQLIFPLTHTLNNRSDIGKMAVLAEYIEVRELFADGCSTEEEFMKYNSVTYQILKYYGYKFIKITSTSWFSWTYCHYAMHYEGKDGNIPYIRF